MADHTATKTAELGALDGRIAPSDELSIPVTDEGLLRGDGVFEVIRVYDGIAVRARRAPRPARALGRQPAPAGCPTAELESEIPELLDARGGGEFDGCLRIVITRGGHRLLLTEPLRPSRAGVRLGIVTYAPDARARRDQVALLRARTCSPRGWRRSAASTRRCSSRRTGACSRRRPRRSSGWTRTARSARRRSTSTSSPRSPAIGVLELLDVEERRCPPETLMQAERGVPRVDHARGAVDRGDRGRRVRGRVRSRARPRRRFRAHVEAELASGRLVVAFARAPLNLMLYDTRRRGGPRRPPVPARPRAPWSYECPSYAQIGESGADRHGHRQPAPVREGGGGLAAAARGARGGARPHRPALRRRALAGLLRRARRAGAGPRARRRLGHEHRRRPRACWRARSRCWPSCSPTSCSSTATPTRRSPARSPRRRRGIPVAHVEAGMRSFDRSMPEELNRVLTDHASDLLLCSTQTAVDNLAREGVARRGRSWSAT